MEEIDIIASQHASMNPLSKDVITPEETERAREARYRVTTITPYVEKPERKIYEMTQEGLDEFFDHYNEFGEFVIKIEEIPAAAK